MPYRWVEHTGELELELRAATEDGVFEAALMAMAELISDGELRDPGERPVVLEAPVGLEASDRPTLLAEWVAELAFLAETEGLVPERLSSLELGPGTLRATVHGRRGAPPNLVKGATYHRLTFERDGQEWLARLVLDV